MAQHLTLMVSLNLENINNLYRGSDCVADPSEKNLPN